MKSMTGYGMSKYEENGRIYTVEIKSVNHKYSDINIRIPREISFAEQDIKKEISNSISRGKIDVSITFENYSNANKKVIVNEELVDEYLKEISKLEGKKQLSTNITIAEILKMPDVLTLQNSEECQENIKLEVIQATRQAIAKFIEMRQAEGEKIKQDLQKRIELVSKLVEKISELSTGLIEEYVVKLKDRISEILKTDIIDETRLATEVVIYADKCSIEEEITRLRSHVNQLENMVAEEEVPVGKKMDFVIQEMNRETNTIGSKSVKLEITNLVVDIKTILEDIREQVQNIE